MQEQEQEQGQEQAQKQARNESNDDERAPQLSKQLSLGWDRHVLNIQAAMCAPELWVHWVAHKQVSIRAPKVAKPCSGRSLSFRMHSAEAEKCLTCKLQTEIKMLYSMEYINKSDCPT